ncbi:unnamed protein product [Mytilus coruscus]|uniref:Reverse transcriptase/retrotransposon-derived protein RNase H-like domain-containing protein n=1 Tax=Mytilus coruscus TaxID=42192 RepID=A0A6J8A1X6_MYTCO|nr:unnamed protein product [Mytilus coruscus]
MESLQKENIILINNIEKSNEKSSKINLDEINVSNEYRSLIEKNILANQDIFAEKDTDLGRTETVKMKIDTGNNYPIKLRPYRTPLNQRPIVEKAIKEMIEANIIRRSQSPWSAPIVLIKKKDNSIRFCIDYRKINQITKIYSTPLAHIDDILALLGKVSFFSNYDLKSGYWQLAMDSKDQTKYLGFVINENGISPDKDKVKVITSLKSPLTVKEVRRFIGMTSLYRRFIPNVSKIAEPIIELTKKYAKLNWSDACKKAFEYLKDSLTVVPLLAYPDTNKTYTLYCDASDTCIGACLTQPCEDTEKKIYGVKSAEKPI